MLNKIFRFFIIVSLFSLAACGGGDDSAPAPADAVAPTTDTTPPYISNANPTAGSTVSTLTTVDLTFSEEVTGADVLSNYGLSGIGNGTLILAAVSYENQIATLSLDGLVGNGAIDISLNNVVDQADNSLPAYTLSFIGTVSSPTQTALPASGTDNLTVLSTVEITYSKEVENADDPANYSLSGTALNDLSLDNVALKTGTTTTYVLTFVGTPSSGILNIDISAINDLVGTPLAGTNITYTFDVTAPQISSTSPADGEHFVVLGSILINYTEVVDGKDLLANYAISGTAIGGSSPLSITSVSSTGLTQSVVSLDGTAVDGDLTLTVSNITDPAGNALAGSNSITITIDSTAPTRSWSPSNSTTINALPTATVTYSEPVLNGDNIPSYNLSGNSKGTLAIESIVNDPVGSNTYVLTLSGVPIENAVYKDVSIISGFPTVTDLAGNSVYSQVQWVIDQTAPTLLSIAPLGSPIAIMELSNVRVEFSEAMSADVTDPASYSLTGAGVGGLLVGTPVLVSGNIYDIPLTGSPGVGDVVLNITPSDVVGNAAAQSITYIFGTQATITSQTSNVSGNLVSVATDGAKIISIASDSINTTQSTDGGTTWGAVYAACGTGLNEIIYSVDKTQWTIIGGTNGSYTAACSSDVGAVWTNVSAAGDTATTTYTVFSGIVYDGLRYVAVGRNPASTGLTTQCLRSISADAQTWPTFATYCPTTTNPLAVSTQPNGIHYVNGQYFITGSSSLLGPVLSQKNDITATYNWWKIPASFTSAHNIIYAGGKYLVAGTIGVSATATIGVSVDLYSWDYILLPDINTALYDIGYNVNGGYIAVGNAGLILTSSDGANWTRQVPVTSNDLKSVVWIGDASTGNWIVVGDGGTVLTVRVN